MNHKDLTINHRLESWVYANAAARLAASGFVAADLGRIAFQTDTHQYWRLASTTPTWQVIGGGTWGAIGGILSAQTDLQLALDGKQPADPQLDGWAAKAPFAGVLTITTGKQLNVVNTVTISGADGAVLNIGAGGVLGSGAYVDAADYRPLVPRVLTLISNAEPAINTNLYDAVTITALAGVITSFTTNLSGAPQNFQRLTIRIKDNGTARAIAWGAGFVSSQATLPTTTVANKVTVVELMHDSVKVRWVCMSVNQEP